MVYGLGIAMILECGAFQLSNANGLSLLNIDGTESLSNLGFIMATFAVVIVVMIYLFNYTKFGYEWRAIRGENCLEQRDQYFQKLYFCLHHLRPDGRSGRAFRCGV